MIKQSWSNIPELKSETQKYKYYRLIDLNDDILGLFAEIALITNSEFIGLLITGDAGPGSHQILHSAMGVNSRSNIHELGICIKYNPDNFYSTPDKSLLTKYSNLLDFIKNAGEEIYQLASPHLQEISEQDYLQHIDNCIQYYNNPLE